MRFKGIIILLLIVAALAVVCASVQPGYDGKAKIVLQLVQMPATPTPMPMPSNMGVGQSMFAEEAYPDAYGFPQTPDVSHGTLLQADVLYSSDPAIKAGDTCTLLVEYDNNNVPSGMQANLLDKLLPGAVVGVNDYTLKGNQIEVDVGSSALWAQQIFILDMSGTKPGEDDNPFKIDLNIFKDFSSLFPARNISTTPTPLPDTWPSPSLWPTPSTFPILEQSSGVHNMIDRFFGWD